MAVLKLISLILFFTLSNTESTSYIEDEEYSDYINEYSIDYDYESVKYINFPKCCPEHQVSFTNSIL